jgi:hypothetical protein
LGNVSHERTRAEAAVAAYPNPTLP